MRWTKENIDAFFYKNKDKILENNILIPHKQLKSLGREYDRWYQAVNIKSNHAYKSMDDFKNQHNITKINPNKKVWTIEKIHNFFTVNKNQLIKEGYLIDVRDIYRLGNDYWNWYQAVNRNYATVEDFKKEVGIKNKQIELKWSKVNIDKFYYKHKNHLLKDGYLKSLSELDKINKEYGRWYKAVSQYLQGGYKNLLSFKIEHKLPLGKNTIFSSKEKITEIIKDLRLFNKKHGKITYKKLKDSGYLFF